MRGRAAVGIVGAVLALATAGPPLAGAQAPEAAIAQPPHFGFNDEWGINSDKLGLVSGTGADTTRAVISWSAVEPQPGQFDFSAYDQLVERMRAAGTRPFWVLADAPCWAWTTSAAKCARKGPIARPPKPGHYDDWAFFAANVAYRYPDSVAIESWNEANLGDFYRPRPNAVHGAELAAWANLGADYAAGYTGKTVPVLFGGSAPLTETIATKREFAYDEFLRDAYDAIPGGYWDGVAIHPFPRFKAREGYLGDIKAHLDTLRAALADSGAAGTPIWVSEIGLSTAGPFPYTPEEQARGLRRIYRSLDAMPDVAAIIVHRLIDGPKRLQTAESGWGVVRRNLTPKPALCALATERGGTCPASVRSRQAGEAPALDPPVRP